MTTDELLGKRVCWTGMGFSLLTEGGTLWRPVKGSQICGTVVDVQPHRFYQTQENVAWLKVKLDRTHGRYKYAQAYFDEKTGRMLDLKHEPTKLV
jgi:hypothetical protein